MATTLYFPPLSLPSSISHNNDINSNNLPDEGEDEDEESSLLGTSLHHHLTSERGDVSDRSPIQGSNPNHPENSPHNHQQEEEEEVEAEDDDGVEEEEEEEEEADEEEEEEVAVVRPSGVNSNNPSSNQPPGGTGVDLGTLIGRRVTLKPRRTLSLSPTPGAARAGDMMARNLRAARWLDFTNEDDDDGLYQPSSAAEESDSEAAKRKTSTLTTTNAEDAPSGGIGKMRVPRRGGSLTLGAMTGLRDFLPSRRGSSSMKRPLEVTLPCQEIQYLDISYQKVGIHTVQFSPIPRKKIAYHPVPYHAIHYCDVPYLGGERPMKRKPPA